MRSYLHFLFPLLGLKYEIYFTSTPPQKLRLLVLNADEEDSLVVGVYYPTPWRLDVFAQGNFVLPTNAFMNHMDQVREKIKLSSLIIKVKFKNR